MIQVIQLMILACQINSGDKNHQYAYTKQRDCHRELVRCADKVYQSVKDKKGWNNDKRKYFVLKECLSK